MNDKTPQFLSTAAAANMLGLSTTLIQSLVDKNELQGWKTRGGHRRISLQSIHDYQAQARMHSSPPGRSRTLPKILVAVESPETLEHLQQKSTLHDFPVTLKFVDSITEALLNLATERPDLLVAELTMSKAQQEKTLQALENFNTRSRPISMVLLTKEKELRTAPAEAPNTIQLAPGPLSDVWLHAYLTGVVATCRT
jgi:excisionase family DNA binding protein